MKEQNPDKKNKSIFISNLAWNYVSIAVLAVSGLVFSAIVAGFYNAAILGVFNQVYAVYMLLSQFAVAGVHLSVTHYIPQHIEDEEAYKSIFAAAMTATLQSSLIVVALLVSVLYVAGFWLSGPVYTGIWQVVPALPFFSFNKVVLGYLNGLSRMRAYAVLQSLRNILIALSIVFLALAKVPGHAIPFCFFITEFILFGVSCIYLASQHLWGYTKQLFVGWAKRHRLFGLKILPGNLVLEFNSKIDILCLGLVTGDHVMVGHYSFASMFSQGFYMLYVVIRRNINPQLAEAHAKGKLSAYYAEFKIKLIKWLRITAFPLMIALCFGYYLLCIIMGDAEYLNALLPLIVIAGSIAATSRSIALGSLMSQTGHPTQESFLNIMTAAVNFLLNLVMIYYWGMLGAAMATAASHFVFALLLRYYADKKLRLII